jgi:predicted RNA methylase
VLDASCGSGRHLAALTALGYSVTGVERDPAVARAARDDQAPMAAVCCNACRTCTTTNLLALTIGAGLGAVYAVGRFARRVVTRG